MSEASEDSEFKVFQGSEKQMALSYKNSALMKMHSAASLDWAITCIKSRRQRFEKSPLGKLIPPIIMVIESMRDDDMKEAKEFMEKLGI